MFLLLALAACAPKSDKDTVGADDSASTDTDTSSGDDTGSLPGDTVGPALPDCTAQSGSGDLVALSGVVLAPEGPVAGSVVYSRSAGTISCVGDCDTTGADVVCTQGIISPGLIDAHNHLQYNTLPPWQVGPEFDTRYEWQSDDRYYDYRTAYDAIKSSYDCEIMKWAEARELVHGTTSAVGSSGGACIDVLIRNLDENAAASGLSSYNIDYTSGNVTDNLSASDGASATSDLASGALDASLNHVAEGRGGHARDEIDYMSSIGMVGPGQYYVHATDASTAQLAQMAADGTGIIWSPRSNLALYGTTTPVEIAEKLGVPWAIGTDWTPSGSMAPTGELACAAEWLSAKGNPISDKELWEKTTTDAARAVGADGVIGALAVGMRADIAVFGYDHTPYRAIIDSNADDVRLVVIQGQALYGTTDMVTSLAANPGWCETLDVCGESRSICMQAGDSGDDAETLADVESTLDSAMAGVSMPAGYEYAGELFPLYTCTDDRDSCDLAAPTSGDADGDGVADGTDLCPAAYDPDQWDEDGDGIGDVCDDCPLTADTECAVIAGDTDGDGVANEVDDCPTVANADQGDRDADGIGDVCDDCPDEANGAGGGCSTTVDAVRDPSNPDHPAEGAVVSLSGLVVTAVKDGAGFAAQDPSLSAWGGIYVYDLGASGVAIGDEVSVDGTYTEFYDLTELTSPTVTITGTASAPAAIAVAACDVATGGSLAEQYESMVVTVSDTTVTDANPDAPNDYDEFVVGGCLRVDDFFYTDLDQPPLDTAYGSLTGVLTYGFDNSKLAPRTAEDLQP